MRASAGDHFTRSVVYLALEPPAGISAQHSLLQDITAPEHKLHLSYSHSEPHASRAEQAKIVKC